MREAWCDRTAARGELGVEHTAETMVVAATPDRCLAVVADVEAYPAWVADVKEVHVLERDTEGRAVVVHFRAGAFGRSTSYVLAYDWSGTPGSVCWIQKEGDLTNRLDGCYRFTAVGDGTTEVRYELAVELRVPIPGFVKRRAEGHILHAAVRDLKQRVESGA
ncbi:MAG: cyclase/dehydrase [Acidimicrobiaceae bacterium]|nr:cyclase/dehydrase [Acidimicrobiaceae bacterium]